MKVSLKIYLLKDVHGNKSYGVVEDSSDTVQICGMKDFDSQNLYFESDAYHLHSWCAEYGIELKVIDRTKDFDELWDNN